MRKTFIIFALVGLLSQFAEARDDDTSINIITRITETEVFPESIYTCLEIENDGGLYKTLISRLQLQTVDSGNANSVFSFLIKTGLHSFRIGGGYYYNLFNESNRYNENYINTGDSEITPHKFGLIGPAIEWENDIFLNPFDSTYLIYACKFFPLEMVDQDQGFIDLKMKLSTYYKRLLMGLEHEKHIPSNNIALNKNFSRIKLGLAFNNTSSVYVMLEMADYRSGEYSTMSSYMGMQKRF